MKTFQLIISALLFTGYIFAKGNQENQVIGNNERDQIKERLRGNGMRFTPNKGQIIDMDGRPCSDDVLYKGNGGGADIYLRKTGISYVYSNMDEIMYKIEEQLEDLINAGTLTENEEQKKKNELLQTEKIKVHRVDMDFADCNPIIRIANEAPYNFSDGAVVQGKMLVKEGDESDDYTNYYYAHCPNGINKMKHYNNVTYKNIYNNIDLACYGDKQNGIKYDLIVHPHSDPGQIKLRWKGAENIYINNKGYLVIKTSVNEFYESIPKVYQNINGRIIDIKTKYILTPVSDGEAIINYSFSSYNSSFPLVIDPWVTYYGGSNMDYGAGITTDNGGNVITTGWTNSINFPVSVGSFQISLSGNTNAFVVKMNAAGTLLWATYYGDFADEGHSVAADNAGNICVSGVTGSTNFPLGNIAGNFIHQNATGGGNDAFIFKLDPSGQRLWATYYGGSAVDNSYSLSTDGTNIYLYGMTKSTTGISTPGAFQPALDNSLGNFYDVFLVKFASNGIRIWGTYFGSSRDEFCLNSGSSVCEPLTGNIYATGYTYGTNFPAGKSGVNIVHQPASGGNVDNFLFKFDPTGARLWSTYYGGTSWEYNSVVTVDGLSNVILGGFTNSGNSISTVGANQIALGGGLGDGYLAKFSSNGTRQWATYIGGNASEVLFGLGTDINNNIYVLGDFEDHGAGNYPISSCAYQAIYGGDTEDNFVAKYDAAGKQKCITYMGGTTNDDSDWGGMAIYGNSIYATGYTQGGYPVTQGAFQTVYGGGSFDAFIYQLCTNICEAKFLALSYSTSTTNVCTYTPVTFTPSVSNACDTNGYKFHWTFTGGTPANSDSVKPTIIFSGTGNHDVKLVITTACKKDSVTKVNYITAGKCGCTLSAQFTKGTANCSGCGCKEWIMINAIGGTSPYSYSWPDGHENRYKNRLCPGTYVINIKDKNGCSVNVNLTAP